MSFQFAHDEKLIEIVRKHWFILFRDSAGVSFLLIAPFLLYGLFGGVLSFDFNSNLAFEGNTGIIVFISALWILIMWMKLLGVWTDYYLDEWMITDKRIIDIDQIGFFKREVSTFGIERIQDVTVKFPGTIPNLLNFGNVHVQTAGASREQFIIKGVADPNRVRQIIIEHYDTYQKQYMRNPTDQQI